MAIGFRSLTQIGLGGATDPTSATTLPSGTATGDLVVAVCALKYASTTITPPSGWQVVTNNEVINTTLTDSGNDAGNTRCALFFREKDAGWSTIPGYDLSGIPNVTMVGAITYTKGAGEVWATPVCANAVDNTTGVTTGIDPPASGTTIPFAAGDWFGSVAVVNGDVGTLGTHTVTVAGVTFGTQVNRLDGTTTGGTDLRVHSVDKPYSSGTASAGPDGALALTGGATTGAGVMVFYRLRLGAPPVTATMAASLDAVTASIGAGTKHPVIMGSSLGAVTATLGAYAVPPGPFTVDFSLYPDGPVPEQETGLRDSFLDIPRSQDEMGIRGGKLAVVNFRGPDQAVYAADAGGGRRGLLWRNTQTLTDNVSGVYDGSIYTGQPPNVPAMQPTLHISTDPSDTWLGIAVWFVPAPYSWAELGVIGWKQEDFSYLDMAPGITPSLNPTDDIRLRSVGGQVVVEVNGVTILGPCPIPAELLGSPIHGVQMDVQMDTDEELGVMESLIIEADSTPLDTRSAPITPGVGTQVEQASATTINVPYPTTVVAGETLLCILCSRNGGTFSAAGWTLIPSGYGAALNTQINVLRKVATGSETGNLTVTKSTAGVMAGMIVRASGDQHDKTSLTGQPNTTASTSMPTPVSKILGPRRTMIWIGATSIDTGITVPTGFTPLHVGVAGGQAIRMAVGVALVDALADAPVAPYNGQVASNMTSRTGTAATSAASAAGFLLLFPAFAGTPITEVPATMAATLGGVTATMGATVTRAPVPATMQASLGAVTASISAGVKVPATMQASLGAVTGTISAGVKVPAAMSAPLGAVTASVTAKVKVPATMSAPLGAVSATIFAGVKVPVTMSAPLSALTGTITAVRRHPAIFAATLSGLTGTMAATKITGSVTVSATMAAPLSPLTGSIFAKVRVPVTMSAPLGGLIGSITATPKIPATLNAPLSAVTGSVTAKPKIPATLSASLSGVTGSVTATPKIPSTLSAPLSGLTGSITAKPKIPAILSAPLSGVTGSVTSKVKVPATLNAPLGSVTGSVSSKVTVYATFSALLSAVTGSLIPSVEGMVFATLNASLSGPTGTITAKVKTFVTLNAPLSGVTGMITPKVKVPVTLNAPLSGVTGSVASKVKIPSILNAPLSGVTGSIASKVKVPSTFYAPLGALTGTVLVGVTANIPATLSAPLSGVTGTVSSKVTVPAALSAPLSGITGTVSSKIKIPVALSAPLSGVTGTIASKVTVPATFFAPLGALFASINVIPPSGSKMYLGDALVSAVYLGDRLVIIGGTNG